MKKITKNEFIEKAKLIHGDKYDYSNVDYVNTTTLVSINCPVHGEFEQIPKSHMNGSGCYFCGLKSLKEKQSMGLEQFIDRATKIYGNEYEYDFVYYVNTKTKVKINCKKHGMFYKTPDEFLKGSGCKECSKTNLRDKFSDDKIVFINKSNLVHKNKYDYIESNYINSKSKVKITCPTHGDFEQKPNDHIMGKGCPKCSLIYNKMEDELKEFIKSLNIVFNENVKKIISPYELDIFIPTHNLAIEFNGLYWHSEVYKDKNYHLNKTKMCQDKHIQLIHIFEDEWLFKKDIVKSRLKNILGLTPNKIYGRKCEIKIVNFNVKKEFLIKNHIQGNVNSKINLGLYYDNELVSLMTFGGLRKNLGNKSVNNKYELLRFCNKLNTTVIGGADKLLKYFIKNYEPNEIVSYADKRWSQGDLYEKLNFDFVHESKPNYFYVFSNKRENRFNYRKDILIKEGFDKTKTEHEIMLERKIYRIYDCGSKKYILKIKNPS